MIAYIEGTVLSKTPESLVVLVSGIGYEVFAPGGLVEGTEIGDHVEVHTYQNVREDALDLYGFEDRSQLELFKQLISVSGVGPRTALAMLSAYSVNEIQMAIVGEDAALLSSVSGIGKKTAERMILDLKDSLAVLPDGTTGAAAGSADNAGASASAVEALVSLGYSHAEAVAALRDVDSTLPVEEQIKAAFKH